MMAHEAKGSACYMLTLRERLPHGAWERQHFRSPKIARRQVGRAGPEPALLVAWRNRFVNM